MRIRNTKVFTFSVLAKILLILYALTWVSCEEEIPPELRNELIGHYQVTATCQTCEDDPKSFEIRISKAGDDGETLIISGLKPVHPYFHKVEAQATSTTTFEFHRTENNCPPNFGPCDDIHSIGGNGALLNNRLIMTVFSFSYRTHDYQLEGDKK